MVAQLESTTAEILAERPFLRGLAMHLSRRHAEADDLVQDTLLRAYRARDRFQRGSSLRAWLGTILRRSYLTEATKRTRRQTGVATDLEAVLDYSPARDEPSSQFHEAELPRVLEELSGPVYRAVTRLPEKYRAPLLLYVYEELTYNEIAARLRIPPGTVMSRIHRAKRRIADALGRPIRPVGERASRYPPGPSAPR